MDFALLLETFPSVARKIVEWEAAKRHLRPPELLASLADRYVKEPRLKRKIDRLLDRLLERLKADRHLTKLLPRDPSEGILILLVLASRGEQLWGLKTMYREIRKAESQPELNSNQRN
jgi:hypothetical protein